MKVENASLRESHGNFNDKIEALEADVDLTLKVMPESSW